MEAIKELLANSLIHQDMTEQGTGPKVEVFEDRIEFTNPGEPLTDWRKLFGAEPRSRNEKLALAMRKMEFCEERGSGLRRTIEATNQAHLLPPEFIARYKHSKVMLYGVGKSFDHMNQKEKIRSCYYYSMILWEQNEKLTNSALRERFSIAGNASVKASAILKSSLKEGWIKIADPDHPNSGYVPFWA